MCNLFQSGSFIYVWVWLVACSLFAHCISNLCYLCTIHLICFLKYFVTRYRAITMRCTLVNPNSARVISVSFLYYVFRTTDTHFLLDLFIWILLVFIRSWYLLRFIVVASREWRERGEPRLRRRVFRRQRRHALSSYLSQFYNLHVILCFTNICYFIPVASVSIDTPTWSACRLLLDTLSSDYI
jgi:hypothetical protein